MALEKFHYEHNGKKLDLPKFDQLPFGLVRKMRDKDESEQFFLIFEGVCTPKQLEVIDTMSAHEVGDLMKAWQEDADVTVGESAASSS